MYSINVMNFRSSVLNFFLFFRFIVQKNELENAFNLFKSKYGLKNF